MRELSVLNAVISIAVLSTEPGGSVTNEFSFVKTHSWLAASHEAFFVTLQDEVR